MLTSLNHTAKIWYRQMALVTPRVKRIGKLHKFFYLLCNIR